jgi:hypothetical protein
MTSSPTVPPQIRPPLARSGREGSDADTCTAGSLGSWRCQVLASAVSVSSQSGVGRWRDACSQRSSVSVDSPFHEQFRNWIVFYCQFPYFPCRGRAFRPTSDSPGQFSRRRWIWASLLPMNRTCVSPSSSRGKSA